MTDFSRESDPTTRRLVVRQLTRMRWVWSLGGLSVTQLAKRVGRAVILEDTFGRTAEISYYFLLALFPFLICLSSVIGVIFTNQQNLYHRLITYMHQVMPDTAYRIVSATMRDVAESAGGAHISISLVAALWTSSLGVEAIIRGLNVAYGIREFRPWWKRKLVAIVLTIVLLSLILIAMLLMVSAAGIGSLIERWLPPGWFALLWFVARWAVVIVFLLIGLNVIYVFSPNLKHQRWQASMPGAIVAFVGWVVASSGFRLYLSYFDSYSKTYGSLGAVIVLLLWFYLSAAALLLGGEVNAQIRDAAAAAGSTEAQEISEAES